MFKKDDFIAFVKERFALATVSTATLPDQPTPPPEFDVVTATDAEKEAHRAITQLHADYNFAVMHHDQNIAEAVKLESCRAAGMAVSQRVADLYQDGAAAGVYLQQAAATPDALDHACLAALAFITSLNTPA